VRLCAQRAAKDAFVSAARSWLEPLEQMLDTEQARSLALENTAVDDFRLVAAIRRQLDALKRYLKIFNTVDVEASCHQTKLRVRVL